MNRREAREQAFVLIFEKLFNIEDSIETIVENAKIAGYLEPDEFALNLSERVYENAEKIDSLIEKFSIGWSISRLPKVTLSILRLAVCEMLFFDDIPVSVSINEAVELSKKYATAEDTSFVNGVLGSVAKSIEEKK